MVALRAEAIAGFLRRPDRNVVLVYGPDTGLVGERAKQILAGVDTGGDPFAHIVIDGDALSHEPGRLAEEAWTVPLFGGRRAIRVTAASRDISAAVKPLVADPPADALLVVEAGDLKKSAPLRKLFEQAEAAAAVPCYADDARALDALIDEEVAAAGLEIAPDARGLLRQLIGGDRLASRQELAKLTLYARGLGRIEAEHVIAVSADASAFALDELADRIGLGEAGEAERGLARTFAAGQAPGAVVRVLSRHFLQLAEARARIDRGDTAEAAMRAMRPPVFFRRQTAFRRQIGGWTADALSRALDMIAAAELETRKRADLGEAVVGRLALALAGAARRGR